MTISVDLCMLAECKEAKATFLSHCSMLNWPSMTDTAGARVSSYTTKYAKYTSPITDGAYAGKVQQVQILLVYKDHSHVM